MTPAEAILSAVFIAAVITAVVCFLAWLTGR